MRTAAQTPFPGDCGQEWRLLPATYTCMGVPSQDGASASTLTPGTRSSGVGQYPPDSWKMIETLSDITDEELPACLERSSAPPLPSLASASSHGAQSNSATLSGFVSVIDALRSLKTVPGATNELRGVDYDYAPIRQTNYLPQQYNGTVVFEFPPASALNDVAQQMEGMDRKRDGHPWCKTCTTNIKNDHKLVFGKIVCVGKLVCHNDDCRFFRRDLIRNGQD